MIKDKVHHVYDADSGKVIAHNLTLEELEQKIVEGIVDHECDDILELEVENYKEASY
jgi:hypothetical protein